MIASEIETGTLEIGENIVGREYQKRIYDKKGSGYYNILKLLNCPC